MVAVEVPISPDGGDLVIVGSSGVSSSLSEPESVRLPSELVGLAVTAVELPLVADERFVLDCIGELGNER
jgi:uncharacterized membrane protein